MAYSGLTAAAAKTLFAAIAVVVTTGAAQAAATCSAQLARGIPRATLPEQNGSAIMAQLEKASGQERDKAVIRQIMSGNVPSFLRRLASVDIPGKLADGRDVLVTICVTPDYLAVGHDNDFVRVPMGLAAAAQIANETGFILPTPKMVDAIYRQAKVRLVPQPMKPTSRMESTDYLLRHNKTLNAQRKSTGQSMTALSAGQKKDIVLTKRLRSKPGRVAIYGWHRPNGKPIQPLSTVHGAAYADYSHGVRLISRTAFVNGKPRDLADLIQDKELAAILSREGPIAQPEKLLAMQY